MLIYMGSQLLGALLALGLFTVVTDVVFSPEVPVEMPLMLSMGMEALLTFVLILTILTVALLDRYRGHVQGIVMGLTLMAVASIGGIFNPAIATAAIIANMCKDGMFVGLYPIMIYVAGPLLAAVVASFSYGYLNENR
jgi:glycerol uptake facilitator-like aquaporin